MRIGERSTLLGGLSPAQFMRRHWQRRPLLVRQALPGVAPPLQRAELFALAARDDVESRLVERDGQRWSLRRGPLPRRALPPLARPGWSLLVQGVDLHVPAAHELLQRFRFVPDARADDVMVSWASAGGGVGPHVDSYDVFLLQVQGTRRWRIARPSADATLRDDVPLKLLARFEPEQEWLLQPGDMLYLPPRWAHDGDAVNGACTTCSIGFRAPGRGELAREVLLRIADATDAPGRRYRDAGAAATAAPARIPPALRRFAADALAHALREPHVLDRALGEWLSEPKPQTQFDAAAAAALSGAVRLDPRSRMLYDAAHLYFNGESYHHPRGADARALRRLADRRALSAAEVAALGGAARGQLRAWAGAGWLHGVVPDEQEGSA